MKALYDSYGLLVDGGIYNAPNTLMSITIGVPFKDVGARKQLLRLILILSFPARCSVSM